MATAEAKAPFGTAENVPSGTTHMKDQHLKSCVFVRFFISDYISLIRLTAWKQTRSAENYGSNYDKIFKIKVENSLPVSLQYNCGTLSEE